MISALWFVVGVQVGACLGAWCAWHFWLRREKPKVELKIEPTVLDLINSAMVSAWLDANGLMWMPKGAEFKAGVKK